MIYLKIAWHALSLRSTSITHSQQTHQTKSMNFYVEISKKNSNLTTRVHPLLLSLAEAVNVSEINPDISTISENDERVLKSRYYTSPGAFPPLETHISGQNGPPPIQSKRLCTHITSVARCRECIGSTPQDSTWVEGNVTQDDSAATFNALDDNLAHIGSASLSPRNKGRKRRRASSGGVQGNISKTRGAKVAGEIRRTKRKQVQNAGLWNANPSPPEEKSDKTMEEVSDLEAEPRMSMFTGVLVQNFANALLIPLKGRPMIQP